jgi:thioredoxin-like negative regulator of GroEL
MTSFFIMSCQVIVVLMICREKSKSLEPEWTKAAATSTDKLISVDCDADVDSCSQFEAITIPDVQLFKSSSFVGRYQGPRRDQA